MNPMRNRKQNPALWAAAFLPLLPDFAMRFKDGGDAGGGAGEGEGEKKKKDKDPAQDKPAAGTVTLTEAELKLRIENAAKDALTKAEKEAKTAKDREDRERKKKEGDLQGLYDSEVERAKAIEAEVDALKLLLKQGEVSAALKDHLIESQSEYAKSARYILPLVEFDVDTDAETIAARVKLAVEQFVKDNPRAAASGAAGAPGSGSRGKAPPGTPETNAGQKKDDKPAGDPRRVEGGRYLSGF
jgi:hypothetical protein